MTVQQRPIHRPGSPESAHEESVYAAFAAAQFRILKDYMALAKLNTYSRVVTLANGVVITCQKSFNREDIHISVPVVEQVEVATPDFGRYAIFVWNPASATFYYLFTGDVPSVWPQFSTLPPSMVTFYPAYFDKLITPLYDQIKTYSPGSLVPDRSVMFQVPILSSYSEALVWQGLLMQPNLDTETQMVLTRYQLTGYLNPYDQPMRSKIILTLSVTNLFEADFSALNIFPASQYVRSGIAYRRLKNATGERMIACIQNDVTYSGQVYEVVESAETLGLVTFGLADLPGGERLPAGIGPAFTDTGTLGRHVDWSYDVFTSERALHYYVVKFCSDTAVTHNIYTGNPYPNDIQLFAGMSLAVEKRLKTDLSLVATYALTPDTVDAVLEGITAAQIFWSAANAQAGGYTTGVADITRFVPQGSGFVLVDEAGTEYPVLPVLACTQRYFGAPLSRRSVLQQSALLWLGAPPDGFDGYTWGGVEATGLKISEVVSGEVSDAGIGLIRKFGSYIGDSNRVMIQALPFDGQLVFFQAVLTTASAVTLECRYFYSGFSAGDEIRVRTDDGLFTYTITSADTFGSDTVRQENIVANAIAAFNAQAVNYAAAYAVSGSDGVGYYTRFIVTRMTEGALDVAATFTLFTQGQSNRQQLLSIRTTTVPIVRLEKMLPTAQAVFMFDI